MKEFAAIAASKLHGFLRFIALAFLGGISALQCGELRADEALPTLAQSNVAQPAAVEPNFFTVLYNAYADEWGKMPPDDPNAPPTRRSAEHIAPPPMTSPPMPWTDWSFGGSELIGGATPNAVDSPLTKALIAGTPFGKSMLEEGHIQIYGWINAGGNLSTAHGYGGNAPANYIFTPNVVELDQAVVYIERVPDTVQRDHLDWGFRISALYGENYRYTTGLGFLSNQYTYLNNYNGYDMPMIYYELYVPTTIGEGLVVRAGRFISPPDIEAQLAPNNTMYTHSFIYGYDNYTNTGVMTSYKVNKNLMVQFGVVSGTETFPWNTQIIQIPGYTGVRDPGAQVSFDGCIQLESDTAADNLYWCVNGLNSGIWGYNNLQWNGFSYYHKFNDQWNFQYESYYMYQRDVRNLNSPAWGSPGTPNYYGTPWLGMINAPLQAQCRADEPTCMASEFGFLAYLNYRVGTFDNVSLRAELYNDVRGQRTGYATRYADLGLGWQHWIGPQIEIRPEISVYRAFDTPAFDNGKEHNLALAACDIIWHF